MKVNEAPEKIYISNFDIEALPKNEQLSERWHEVSTQNTDIEYARTDAFIEKAEMWLNKELYTRFSGNQYFVASNKSINLQEFIKSFKNYMKGEKS